MKNPGSHTHQPQPHQDTRPKRKLLPLLNLIDRFFPWLGQKRKRKYWEKTWLQEGDRPESLSTKVPIELKQSVDDGWLPAGSSVMDIGCGRGQISAWLAERGFKVTGGDLADAAVDLARKYFPDFEGRLKFRQLDIIRAKPEHGRFDVAVDRGCFHGIPENLKVTYVKNVGSWVRPQGRFLLLTRIDGGSEQTREHIRSLFTDLFEIERWEMTAEPLIRSEGPLPRRQTPGLVFWMLRK